MRSNGSGGGEPQTRQSFFRRDLASITVSGCDLMGAAPRCHAAAEGQTGVTLAGQVMKATYESGHGVITSMICGGCLSWISMRCREAPP